MHGRQVRRAVHQNPRHQPSVRGRKPEVRGIPYFGVRGKQMPRPGCTAGRTRAQDKVVVRVHVHDLDRQVSLATVRNLQTQGPLCRFHKSTGVEGVGVGRRHCTARRPASDRTCVNAFIGAGCPLIGFRRARSAATSIRGSANSQALRAASRRSAEADASTLARPAATLAAVPARNPRRSVTIPPLTRIVTSAGVTRRPVTRAYGGRNPLFRQQSGWRVAPGFRRGLPAPRLPRALYSAAARFGVGSNGSPG